MRGGSSTVVYAGVAGNLLVALTKFAAAAFTHSSAMLSEAVHSLVDTCNQLLLLYGLRRSERPPDRDHPLGHARELYFWSFVVSLLIFALGAGVSVYEGIRHIQDPVEIEYPLVNYCVLALAAVFEGVSWLVALRAFRAHKGRLGYLEAAQESKQLLIGERARPQLIASICRIARTEPGIEQSNGLLTVQLGPRQVVAALSLDFADTLTTPDIEKVVAHLEDRIRAAHPEVVILLVKPESRHAQGGTDCGAPEVDAIGRWQKT
ncbi:MAG TPA: cation transporter [Burkholderiales bacterium]|nr:cation transporter [Burkholderiales bacterium]